MIDLDAPAAQPAEVELAPGLNATVRPLTGLLQCQVAAELAHVMQSIRSGAGVAARFGVDAGDVTSIERRLALGDFARAVILASHTITTWSLQKAGAAAPVNEANAARLFDQRPDAMAAFLAHVEQEARARAAEGESWRPAAGPSSAARAGTAPDASSSTPTAPAASQESTAPTAPASSMSPAPPTESR